MKEIKILTIYASNAFQQTLSHRFIAFLLFIGKLLRILLFLFFLTIVFQGTKSLVGYTKNQVIFFYLSFNLIDTSAQLLFREVYRFRTLIIRGDLDLVLVKPVHPLIRVLLGGPDLLDLLMLFLILGFTVWFANYNFTISLISWVHYILLIFSALIISASLHILVLCLGVITTSVDHLILIYRDLTSLMRIPVDVYADPFKSILTFLIPLGIMYSFPPKIILGLTSSWFIILSIIMAGVFLTISLKLWNLSIRNYQSASS